MKSLNFKMFLLVFGAIVVFGQPVCGADTPSYDWSGFYVGVHLGAGFGNADTGITPLGGGVPTGAARAW